MQDLEDGLEFHHSYENDLGTGYIAIVSNPESGMVDLVISQIVAGDTEGAEMVSVSLPPDAAGGLIRALSAGYQVAMHQQRLRKFN